MRNMFADASNSFWHIAIGAYSNIADSLIVGVAFATYQIVTDWGEANFAIDMLEFVFGHVLAEVSDWKRVIS